MHRSGGTVAPLLLPERVAGDSAAEGRKRAHRMFELMCRLYYAHVLALPLS